MTLQNAIQKRITDLCEERSIPLRSLHNHCGVARSTIEGIFQNKNPQMTTLEKLCNGLGISLADFFCCDTFRNLDPQ